MKILIAAAVSVAMLFSTVPANANNDDVVIGILGGALGGLIVGEVIGSQRRPIYVEPAQPIYVQPAPPPYYDPYEYEQPPQCVVRYVRKWDPNRDRYVKIRREICD